MGKFIYDFTDGEIITSFGDMAVSSKGDMFMRFGKDSFMNTTTGDVIMRTGSNTAMHLNTGKMHFFSGNWDDE